MNLDNSHNSYPNNRFVSLWTIFDSRNNNQSSVKKSRTMNILVKISAVLLVLSLANAAEKKETLVLLDNLAVRETHSIFFKNLQGNEKF